MADVFVSERILSQIVDHADIGSADDKEVMGLIIGTVYHDDRGEYAVAGRVHTGELAADEDSVRFADLAGLYSALDLKDGERIIGWYHSHLGDGCDLSPTDIRTQTGIFGNECAFALVVDPVRQEIMIYKNGEEGPVRAEMVVSD